MYAKILFILLLNIKLGFNLYQNNIYYSVEEFLDIIENAG